jgi:hypothetical protein
MMRTVVDIIPSISSFLSHLYHTIVSCMFICCCLDRHRCRGHSVMLSWVDGRMICDGAMIYDVIDEEVGGVK